MAKTATSVVEQAPARAAPALPLCVDLDGTLIATDVFVESTLAVVARHPLWVPRLALLFLHGRSRAKSFVSEHGELDVEALPYREDVLEFLREERAKGRTLVLATAAHRLLAQKVAAHLGLFDDVLASSGSTNLKGTHKAEALAQRFGEKGFSYAGDARVDQAVWARAGEAVVVGSAALARRAARTTPVAKTFAPEPPGLKAAVRALRVHQWLKNLLVFLPAFAAHRLRDPATLVAALIAFWAFSLCASAVYVANDLADLSSDRRHRSKRTRPFASGAVPIAAGLGAIPLLLLSSAVLATLLPPSFGLVLASYFVLTTLYTFSLKRIALVDVLALAGLYAVRIFAGGAAAEVAVSPWLIAFALFLFLSLALVKRVSELQAATNGGASLSGRGYQPGDLEVLRQMGIASGYLAVLVLALYLQSAKVEGLYRRPELLWLACPLLLFWVSRAWLVTHRGEMHDDPVVFALRDPLSLAVGVLTVLIVVLAT